MRITFAAFLLLLLTVCSPQLADQARFLQASGDYEQLAKLLNANYSTTKEQGDLLFLLGRAQGEVQDYHGMDSAFSRLVREFPTFREMVKSERNRFYNKEAREGLRALRRNDLQEADSHFAAAVVIRPGGLALPALAFVRERSDSPLAAATYMEILKPRNAGLYGAARVALVRKDAPMLLALGRQLEERDPCLALNCLAQGCFFRKEYRKALGYWQQLEKLESCGEKTDIAYNQALAYYALGEYGTVTRLLLDAEEPWALRLAALAYLKAKKWNQAFEIFQRLEVQNKEPAGLADQLHRFLEP